MDESRSLLGVEHKLLQVFNRIPVDTARCKVCCWNEKATSHFVLVCASCKEKKKSCSDGDFLCENCRTRRRCHKCDTWKEYADFLGRCGGQETSEHVGHARNKHRNRNPCNQRPRQYQQLISTDNLNSRSQQIISTADLNR